MNESSEASAGTVRISLCQAASVPGDVASNLLSVERHLREFAHVSDLVVFPEVHADTLGAEMYSHKPQLFLTGYGMHKSRMLKVSMSRADEALTRVSEMAKSFKCGVVVSFPERPDLRTDVMFIAAVAFDSEGREVCFYRKRHLWKGVYEKSMFTAGEEGPTAFCVQGVRLGLGSLCVQVGVFVSACSASDMTRIQVLAQAVAKEHRMLICYVNHSWGRLAWFSGDSFMAWPSGDLESCSKKTPDVLRCLFTVALKEE